MHPQRKIFWTSLGFAGAVSALAMGLNWMGWNRRSLQLAGKLLARTPVQSTQNPQTVAFENFDQLPEPVARYLRFALKEGQPLIHAVRVVQTGKMRGLEHSQARWMPFHAVQFCVASRPGFARPGFVWDACIRASLLIWLRVRDSYVAGQGAAEVSALSLVTLADEHGSAELAQSALLRYLAEAVWFPTALLPSASLVWSPVCQNKAVATLTDHGTTVSLKFHFNEADEVEGVYTPGRYRAVAGQYVLTGWGGRHSHYEEKEGMQVPTESEVEWHLPDGIRTVWKGRTAEAAYQYAEGNECTK